MPESYVQQIGSRAKDDSAMTLFFSESAKINMKHFIPILVVASLCTSAGAQEASQQADSFLNIYATTCMRHISSLDTLRGKLAPLPSLPPEKASHFLNGQQGKAWPVPDKHGVFVLAIPDGKDFCSVSAVRVNGPEAVLRFKRLVATAPPPLNARELVNTSAATQSNGVANTLAYAWATSGAARSLRFMLTTADSPSAQIQGLVSASFGP